MTSDEAMLALVDAAGVDPMFAENLCEARRMTPEERVRAACRLSDYAIKIALAGVRDSHPEASEEEVLRILERRIELQKRLERLDAVRTEDWHGKP